MKNEGECNLKHGKIGDKNHDFSKNVHVISRVVTQNGISVGKYWRREVLDLVKLVEHENTERIGMKRYIISPHKPGRNVVLYDEKAFTKHEESK